MNLDEGGPWSPEGLRRFGKRSDGNAWGVEGKLVLAVAGDRERICKFNEDPFLGVVCQMRCRRGIRFGGGLSLIFKR